jgi:hypothetical protein
MNMPAVSVSITVDDAHLDQLLDIAQQLQSAGLRLDQTLPRLGIIHGSIDAERIDQLRSIDGVDHVEPEHTIQLPPPGSDIQ